MSFKLAIDNFSKEFLLLNQILKDDDSSSNVTKKNTSKSHSNLLHNK